MFSLSRAPARLRTAVRSTLGVRTGSASSAHRWTKLNPSHGARSDNFGYSVAIYGSTAVVGAPANNSSRGAAYVFMRSGGHWSQRAKLTAPHRAAGDQFGYSVAIYGSTAVVGAPFENSNAGAAYVFARVGARWSQRAKLTASRGAARDNFGYSVAIYGSTVVVGAYGKNSFRGTAYVFVRSDRTWSRQATLTASDGFAGDQFGYSVALHGSTAVVGAPAKNSFRGAAYVFARSGTHWSRQATLSAHSAAFDEFGCSVALYGPTAVVGADGKRSFTGAAYVFARSGEHWSRQAELTASHAPTGDQFGYSVALSGSRAVIGAYGKNFSRGAAYVFARSGAHWSQRDTLTASHGARGDQFGWSVALYGSRAVVGAPFKTASTGAAYVIAGL